MSFRGLEQRVGCLALLALAVACSDGESGNEPRDSGTLNPSVHAGSGGRTSDAHVAGGASGAGGAAAGRGSNSSGEPGRGGAGGSADSGAGAGRGSSASGSGGSASQAGSEAPPIGTGIFPGPPYGRPALPVRRLATATYDGPTCVVLEDRSIHCVERYFSDTPRDVSGRVPRNQDYQAVTYSTLDGRFFYGFHDDGSVDTWRDTTDMATDQTLTGAVYLAAFIDAVHTCGLRDDGELECDAAVDRSPFPAGPMVDFAGTLKQPRFAALRADGLIVSTDGVFAGGKIFNALVTWSIGRNLCGVTTDDELFCDQFRSNPDRVELTLIAEGPFRDVSQGLDHVCYLAQDGRATCVLPEEPSPSTVPADLRFVDIATSSDANTCGVTEQGELWCWSSIAAEPPVQVPLPMKAAVD